MGVAKSVFGRWPSPRSRGFLLAGWLLASVALGALVSLSPELLLPAASFVVGFFLFRSATLRLGFLVVGGIVVLQSSNQLDTMKLVYLAGSALVLPLAAIGAWRARKAIISRAFNGLLLASAAVAATLAVSLGVALSFGTPFSSWLRDATSYLLLAAVPIVAMDAAANVPNKRIVAMFTFFGLFITLSFTVAWLERRHLAGAGSGRLAYYSFFYPAALECFATVKAVFGRKHRLMWATVAGTVLLLMAMTGTRSAVLLLVGPGVVALRLAAERRIRPIVVAVLIALLSSTIAAAIGMGVIALLHVDLAGSWLRLTTLVGALHDPLSDQSVFERMLAVRVSWATFLSSPLYGVGPGHLFERLTAIGTVQPTFTLDTSLTYLAKFGLFGVPALFALGAGLVTFLRYSKEVSRVSAPHIALLGYLTFAVVSLLLMLPLEDKGFSFALVFLLALCASPVTSEQMLPTSTETLGSAWKGAPS